MSKQLFVSFSEYICTPTLWQLRYIWFPLNLTYMLKRTYGRLLLTLLVATGLAGKVNDTSLTKAERKELVSQYKETRTDLLSAIKGLSETQANFKPAPDRWSVRECVAHITLTEEGLWQMLEQTMQQPATPEKRSEVKVSDADVLKNITTRNAKFQAPENFQPVKASWTTLDETADAFKTLRARHLKYARTTTEDLRNHIVDAPFGKIDAYQFMLFIAGHSNRHTQQLREVMNDPAFPRK